MTIWSTSQPTTYLIKQVSDYLHFRRYPKWTVKLLNCPVCSSFWLSPFIYLIHQYAPEYILYAIYLCGTYTIVTPILDKLNSFKL